MFVLYGVFLVLDVELKVVCVIYCGWGVYYGMFEDGLLLLDVVWVVLRLDNVKTWMWTVMCGDVLFRIDVKWGEILEERVIDVVFMYDVV